MKSDEDTVSFDGWKVIVGGNVKADSLDRYFGIVKAGNIAFSAVNLIFALQKCSLNLCKIKQSVEFHSFLNRYLLFANNMITILFSIK